MNNFKTLHGVPVPDIINYIKDYLNERAEVELLVGSDSQSYSNSKTVYGVVIALYTKGKGAHVLCTKDSTPFEKDTSNRLMTEVWKAVEVAEFLRENGLPKASFIDIDLNPDPRYRSNKVLRQAVGLVEGMGYRVRYKHNGAMMTYSANHLVRI
jgi:predicted RNase H-related nuclease YkuK (DUF458 family)